MARNNRPFEPFFQGFSGVTGNFPAGLSVRLKLFHSLRIFIAVNFCRRAFTQHRKDQFKIIHVVPKILSLEAFQLLVFVWCYPESGLRYLRGQYFILLIFFGATFLPFIG